LVVAPQAEDGDPAIKAAKVAKRKRRKKKK
jgi:hypothetical protein